MGLFEFIKKAFTQTQQSERLPLHEANVDSHIVQFESYLERIQKNLEGWREE